MIKRINLPLTEQTICSLHVGEQVLLNGELFTARDAAHKRLVGLLKEGRPLPVNLKGNTVYYVGPCPTPTGKVVGSCGPTTSGRCDIYAPTLIEHGLKGMIGKGYRNTNVMDSIKKHKAIYFVAIGGAGALYARCVLSCEIVAFEDLGAEAIHKFIVKDFPVVVAIDSEGKSIY